VTTTAAAQVDPDYEFLIVGAGVCGLYQLYRLQQLGVRVRALEAHDDLGGTWYRNRYPGCRFDSESYTYGYSFSDDVLAEWDWSELFASQPETLSYLNFVADKYDLRRDIDFGARVTAARFDETTRCWVVDTETGSQYTTRFLLTAVGLLSIPTTPRYEGMDTFAGRSFHTADWPAEGVDLQGQRVAVIGTGSSGVQVISTIAEEVAELTVFQRSPNWCVPLSNRSLDATEMARIKGEYRDIFDRCYNSPSLFIHAPDRRRTVDVSEAERLELWEKLYWAPGFGLWLGNFKDTMTSASSNAEVSRFVAAKIRERVSDPAVAEVLIPKDHGFGTKRVPLETQYYETFNRPNVELVDLLATPVARVTRDGILTTNRKFDLDVIVYATGFDAITGAFDHIDIVGTNGVTLREKWAAGPLTFLGLQVSGFPNLFTILGPQSGSASTNFPRGIEQIVDWMTEFVQFIRKHDYTRVEAKPESERTWVEHVAETAQLALMGHTKSWFTGHNTNLDRDDRPRLMLYTGGSFRFRRWMAAEVDSDYAGFRLDK
jgi:cation diffusion facilitator CzcD-associated flavoprotein CzcO